MSPTLSLCDRNCTPKLRETTASSNRDLLVGLLRLLCVGALFAISAPPLFAQENKFVVVIDPGHGGTKNLPGSNANNASGPLTKTLEKDLTLKYCKALRARIKTVAAQAKKNVSVILTRDTDINLSAEQRTAEVRKDKAPIFLVLHFNADNGAGKARGSLYVDRVDSNVNRQQDNALAEKIVAACVRGLAKTDAQARQLDPIVFTNKFPAVSNDQLQGNTAASARTRMAYLETEFLNNPKIDELLNKPPTQDQVMNDICEELSRAILNEVP